MATTSFSDQLQMIDEKIAALNKENNSTSAAKIVGSTSEMRSTLMVLAQSIQRKYHEIKAQDPSSSHLRDLKIEMDRLRLLHTKVISIEQSAIQNLPVVKTAPPPTPKQNKKAAPKAKPKIDVEAFIRTVKEEEDRKNADNRFQRLKESVEKMKSEKPKVTKKLTPKQEERAKKFKAEMDAIKTPTDEPSLPRFRR